MGASIKRPDGRLLLLLDSPSLPARCALFIIVVLGIQLVIGPSLGADGVPQSPAAGLDGGAASSTTQDPAAAAITEKPAGEAVNRMEMSSRTGGGADQPGVGGAESPTLPPQEATTTMDALAGSLTETPESRLLEETIAAADAKRTSVKKELTPTSEPTPREEHDGPTGTSSTGAPNAPARNETSELAERQQPGPLGSLLVPVNREATELAGMSPGLASAIGELSQQLPTIYSRNENSTNETIESMQRLLPSNTNLFDKEAIDATQLDQMDCHLRNIDYCLAGLLGTAQKILPETDSELETRCDEMKATTSCIAVYNKRCSTLKIFSVLAPFAQQSTSLLSPNSSDLLTDRQRELAGPAAGTLMSQPVNLALVDGGGVRSSPGKTSPASAISVRNMMEICEPHAKSSPGNKELRQRLFQLAKCVNGRVPTLNPCFDDLKTAIQLFYEPRRLLPMQPTCCALARFRSCSISALDGVCGLSSFEQLMQAFPGQERGGPMNMLTTIERVCRQASDHRSSYCKETLPPSGMKVTPRRGSKASKLAKALDLISFSPAAQGLGAF